MFNESPEGWSINGNGEQVEFHQSYKWDDIGPWRINQLNGYKICGIFEDNLSLILPLTADKRKNRLLMLSPMEDGRIDIKIMDVDDIVFYKILKTFCNPDEERKLKQYYE